MEFGKIEYRLIEKRDGVATVRKLDLTLIGLEDKDILYKKGVRALRHNRIMRLLREAEQQGGQLSYEDLSGLLLTSLATLKRDVSYLEGCGYPVDLKGKRKNGFAGGGAGRPGRTGRKA